jgi:hypothetical protein
MTVFHIYFSAVWVYHCIIWWVRCIMGVYLVTLLWTADSFFYLVLLTRNLQQAPRKIPMSMTQNGQYAGRDSYRNFSRVQSSRSEPNGLCMLDTFTIYVPTWTNICEWYRSMAKWQRFRFYSEVQSLIFDQETPSPGWCFSRKFCVSSGEWRDSTSIRPLPLPHKASSDYHTFNMPLDAIRFKILLASSINL